MRKRQRYIIEYVASGDQHRVIHVLAYSEDEAREWIATTTGPVVSSRLAPRRHSNAGKRPTWQVDEAALRAAKSLFGISWPVRITRTSSAAHNGVHRLRIEPGRRTPVHSICVEKCATLDHASRVLWHELTHAMQAERAAAQSAPPYATARDMWRSWKHASERSRTYAYDHRPCEVEARSNEYRAENAPLTIPA